MKRSDMFSQSTYANEYGNPAEMPDCIVRNNAAAVAHVLANLDKFPTANVAQLNADDLFLSMECAARGITPRLGIPHGKGRSETAMTIRELYEAWVAADQAWSHAIELAFPKEWPGDVRYMPKGKGEPGTLLRAACETRQEAEKAFRAAGGFSATSNGVERP